MNGVVIRVVLVLLALTLSGCVTGTPETIRQGPLASISVAQAQRDAPRFLGQPVRWGGEILSVQNREDTTQIEVLARPLDADGEPRSNAEGDGRFIAEIPEFVDPAEYPQGRQLTVRGRLLWLETRPVGDYPYRYPVVAAEQWHLWPEEPARLVVPAYPHPWYDPWYFDRYRPWHYYPW